MNSSRKLTIIAKPTHSCNLNCKYCYLEESAEKGKMSENLLAQSIQRVSDFVESSHWIWHGGEPLLMGIDFYKSVKDIQNFYKKKGNKFSNGIQTNGTLIAPDLINFCEQTKDFHIGVSIDGPKEIHDKTRIYKDGSGSFDEALNGQKLLRGKRIGGGVICVLSSKNINHPQELYNFFKSEKINVKFNPLIKSGKAKENINDLGISPNQYGKFLLKMWDIYNQDVKKEEKVTINVDPFIEVIGNIGTNRPLGCNYSISCRESFISIGPNGDIYPCGRFDGIKEFWMGNIKENTIEDAVSSKINRKLKERNLEKITDCSKCNFGDICNSGCMHNAYCNGNIFGKDPYCASYKTLFQEMKKVLDDETELKGGCKYEN
ncbi:MAG: radical SAM protein [Candidatus Pacearchaeota archaeon]|nr:radical SAM protein [Candidatus Pacearchaeota archaeon]